MGKPQLTQLPNYQNYQNVIKVKMTIFKFFFWLKKLSFSFKFRHFLTNQTENREKVSSLCLLLPEASSNFKNPHFPCSKLNLNRNTCPWKPPEPPPPSPRSPELSWSIIRSGSVLESPKPPSAPVKPASTEAKLGRPRICSRKSSLVAFDGLLAMRWNSLSRTRPSRGESHWQVTSFKEHLQRKKERERVLICFVFLCFALPEFRERKVMPRKQRKMRNQKHWTSEGLFFFFFFNGKGWVEFGWIVFGLNGS